MVEIRGEAWNLGWRVHLRCAWGRRDGLKSIPECTYSKMLDLETLVCTRGRDFPLSLLAERSRCPRCGSRKIRIAYEPPTTVDEARARSDLRAVVSIER